MVIVSDGDLCRLRDHLEDWDIEQRKDNCTVVTYVFIIAL